VFDFTRAVELCEAEIREGAFTHDGDPRLARHVANARRRPNRYGQSIGKETPSSPKKIDAAVAMIGARMVRRLTLAAAPSRKRSGRVWA
jgi:phage terminase large subunit-like protein